jgi:predicted nucleic acid-binding protein
MAAFLHGRKGVVDLVTPWIINREVATSILVYGEVIEYMRGFSDFPQRRSNLRQLLNEVYPYFLTYSILDRYADLRRQLRPPYGTGLIGDIDTLIAATALERDLTLVTADADYERVLGLKVKRISLK